MKFYVASADELCYRAEHSRIERLFKSQINGFEIMVCHCGFVGRGL